MGKFKNCLQCRIITAGIVIAIGAIAALWLMKQYDSGCINKLPKDTVKIEDSVVLAQKDTLYEFAIDFLKDYEGFRSKRYRDNDGSLTIGYGHHLRFGENYTNISEEKATEILKKDFDKYIQEARDSHDKELKYNQEIAIALFMYNCGAGKYNRSTMKKNIELCEDPSHVWLKYCHYKKDGVMVAHPKLKERRQIEVKIFKNGK